VRRLPVCPLARRLRKQGRCAGTYQGGGSSRDLDSNQIGRIGADERAGRSSHGCFHAHSGCDSYPSAKIHADSVSAVYTHGRGADCYRTRGDGSTHAGIRVRAPAERRGKWDAHVVGQDGGGRSTRRTVSGIGRAKRPIALDVPAGAKVAGRVVGNRHCPFGGWYVPLHGRAV
jgi:hypothetical protein